MKLRPIEKKLHWRLRAKQVVLSRRDKAVAALLRQFERDAPLMPAARPQKIALGDMREMGVRGILIYCADYHCSHSLALMADRCLLMRSRA